MQKEPKDIPNFGCACSGNGDRTMILGKQFYVTHSDSIAILAANSTSFMKTKLTGVSRTLATAGALDQVAKNLKLCLYEVPLAWEYSANLMDAGLVQLCGDENFSIGSSHIREKDGIWTILAWLSIIADRNKFSPEGELVGVKAIVEEHLKTYGRNYFCSYYFLKEIFSSLMHIQI